LEGRRIVDYFRVPSDADLIVFVVEVAEFAAGVCGELARFSVSAEVGDVDGEAVDSHR
jgi:hypothetical protein